jgi:IS5 family transposase
MSPSAARTTSAFAGDTIERDFIDARRRGHNAPPDYKFKIQSADQKRGVTLQDDMIRPATVKPVISHLKVEHHMGRNHFAHCARDAIAVLAAVGDNFRFLPIWARLLLRAIPVTFWAVQTLIHMKSKVYRAQMFEHVLQ